VLVVTQVLKRSGTEQERRHARRIMPVSGPDSLLSRIQLYNAACGPDCAVAIAWAATTTSGVVGWSDAPWPIITESSSCLIFGVA
jgi:hypothetical protein